MSDAADVEENEPRRVFRPLRWAAYAFMLVVAYLAFNFVDVWWASRSDGTTKAQAAVVMGAAQYNGEPSPVLQGRLDRSVELFESGTVPMIVVTGGSRQGDAETEASASYNYLRREAGLADSDIRLEVQGASTYESLAATARFLKDEGTTEVVLVTDPFHAKRASLVASEVGLEVVDVAVTSAPVSFDRLLEETGGVSLGRIIGFRRLQRFSQE